MAFVRGLVLGMRRHAQPKQDELHPGPNWGGRANAAPSQPSYDYEAERARQEAERQRQEEELRRQEEERLRREAEERQRRQEEFERNKQQALRDMKGIGGELGLKGLDTGDNFGLKGLGDTGGGLGLKTTPSATPAKPPECKWGDQGSSVVDLRCLGLDPNRPVTLDFHVVRGQQRVFPAQVSAATLQNPNWHKGWMALAQPPFSSKEAEASIAAFKAAQLQRPNDPMIRMALYIADGILQARYQKEEAQAEQKLHNGLAALMLGDLKTATASIEEATHLAPKDASITQWEGIVWGLGSNYPGGSSPACKLASTAFLFEAIGQPKSAIRALEVAAKMFPKDAYIRNSLFLARQTFPDAVTPPTAPRSVARGSPGSSLNQAPNGGPKN